MRRGRILILLALILLGIALAAYFFLRQPPEEPTPLTGTQPTPLPREATIIIAAQNIPRGAVIPNDGVITAPFPLDMVVETMATDVGQVVGRRARTEIARGMPITTEMVTDQAGDLLGSGSDAALAIEPGKTAISIPLNRLSGVAFALRSGDEVDVIVSMLILDIDTDFQSVLPNLTGVLVSPDRGPLNTFVADWFDPVMGGVFIEQPREVGRAETDVSTGELLYVRPYERQRPRLITQRLVEKATVLHVGTFALEEEVTPTELIAAEEEGAAPPQAAPIASETAPPDIITLVVTPQDALAINYAVKSGYDIVLTLRGPDDFTESQTTMVSLQYLIESYNMAVPQRLSYSTSPRVDLFILPLLPGEEEGTQ
jgi:pilus assembly protein CpaB